MSGLRRMLIIAEREFLAYASSPSFWVALAIGPLLMAGAVAIASLPTPPRIVPVSLYASEPALAQDAIRALNDAARLDGRPIHVLSPHSGPTQIVVSRRTDGQPMLQIADNVPLSSIARAYLRTRIERDSALNGLHLRPPADIEATAASPALHTTAARPDAPARPIGRFMLVMMLWLTLTGSLGMLLQASVRERTNRALESLLSAANPWEVTIGKLTGVGAISLLVLLTWLASCLVTAVATNGAGGMTDVLFREVGKPWLLAGAIPVYVLGYFFFGLITIAVGAFAADGPSAQNLSRPMFAVLLAAFFVALAATGGSAAQLKWLIFVPPFAPFMLLLTQPTPMEIGLSLILLSAATVIAGQVAVNAFSLRPQLRLFNHRKSQHRPA